jgi:hypothetical protein
MWAHHITRRAPAFDPSAAPVDVAARLITRTGDPIRVLESTGATAGDGVVEFTSPLASLPAGSYQIDVTGTSVNGRAAERVAFRVTR